MVVVNRELVVAWYYSNGGLVVAKGGLIMERVTRGGFRQDNSGGVKRWLIRRGFRSDWGGI